MLSEDDSKREPWTCDACGIFIYNKDSEGRPAPGAPSSYFGGEYGGRRYEKVCTMCYQLKDILMNGEHSDYWRGIQNTADTIRNQRLQKLKEQGGGNGAL